MTPEQKREAWVRFAAEVAAVGVSLDGGLSMETTTNATLARHCGAVADALLSEVEQREREGRFGAEEVPPPAGYSLKGWANTNAVKRMNADFDGAVSVGREQRGRADRAESLLKEALRSAGRLMNALEHLAKYGRPAQGGEQTGNVAHIEQALGEVGKTLARARQEGFEP